MKFYTAAFAIFFIVSSLSLNALAARVDKIAVIVNDKAITLSELHQKMIEAAPTFGVKIKDKAKILNNSDLRQKTVDLMIRENLVDEQIKKRNLEVTDAQLEMFIKNIMKQNGLTSLESLKSALALQNMSYEDYKESLKNQIQRTKIMNFAARSRVNISERDIKNYYTQNTEEAREPDSFYLKNIFIGTNDSNKSDKKKLAQKAIANLNKGKDFEAVVKKYSEDSNAETGGDLGFMTSRDLNPEIYAQVSRIKPGQHTKIIETPTGFYILKLNEIKKGKIRAFEEVKEELRNKLTAKQTESRFNAWVEELKSNAFIDIKI